MLSKVLYHMNAHKKKKVMPHITTKEQTQSDTTINWQMHKSAYPKQLE